jgi:diguanylate cyclase (GGDEF)-like protein
MVEKLNDVSAHDSLTGIHSRRHFDHMLKIEWRRAARGGRPLSLLLADIDSFKAYNDRLGHLAGDECLRRVAEAIRQSVHRAADVVARYGGEEIAVLLPDTDPPNALHLAETIRRRVNELHIPHIDSPTCPELTISVGVATAQADGDEEHAIELIHFADRALYAAKRAGRNRALAYTAAMEPRGRKHGAAGIDVYFDARLCTHAERCVAGLPAVFQADARPWIQPANAAPDEIAAVVGQCPTGALHYVRRDGGADEMAAEDRVAVVVNGPLNIVGDITLLDENGDPIRADTRMSLCRCGVSRNKPFCDNSHIGIKFEG